jgi:hypothetical protein
MISARKAETGHQSLDRADARPHCAAVAARHGQRGERITTFFTAAQNVCFWHKADIGTVVINARF